MDPFDIFPVKVWEEILKRLEDPRDKLNLIKTNSALELLDLFQDEGTEWYFYAVLPLLLGHLYRPGTQPETLPWHRRGELKSAVLNCRLVSKGTKKIVDNFVDTYWNDFCWLPPFTTPDIINSLEHVERCLEQAGDLNRNDLSQSPFIGGGLLYLHCGEGRIIGNGEGDETAVPSLEKAIELVSHPNIGNNLRGIRIFIAFLVDNLQETYNFVKNLLQSVPNVLTVSIIFLAFGNELQAEVPEEETPFPELSCLKDLRLEDYIHNDGYSLIRDNVDFKQYFEQLTTLDFTFFLWKDQYKLVQFSQLKSILFHDVPISGWNNRLLQIIENLNAPALESLILKTRDFHLVQQSLDLQSFEDFFNEKVLQGSLGRRPKQSWNMDRRQTGAEMEYTLFYNYVFSRTTSKSTSKA